MRHAFRNAIIVGALLSVVIPGAAALAGDSRVPVPSISKGQGERCVEDTQFMRRNHMELMMHQRDDTLRRGVRTTKHSLKECLDCHAVKGDDNQPVSFQDPRHFCTACHSYAAVKIDCFECHNSKPRAKTVAGDITK